MRKTFLATAALFGLACLPAIAQTATPDQTPTAPAPDAGVATDTPVATGTPAPAKPVHHHHVIKRAMDSDGQSFAHEPGTG